jgi:hypothetical protein
VCGHREVEGADQPGPRHLADGRAFGGTLPQGRQVLDRTNGEVLELLAAQTPDQGDAE